MSIITDYFFLFCIICIKRKTLKIPPRNPMITPPIVKSLPVWKNESKNIPRKSKIITGVARSKAVLIPIRMKKVVFDLGCSFIL